MAAFDKFAGVDENFNFPPEVARQIYNSPEGAGKFLKGDKGDKGDPGGFVASSDIGSANLNSILIPGLYRQSNTANVSTVNNYPTASGQFSAFQMRVVTWGGAIWSVMQEATYAMLRTPSGRLASAKRFGYGDGLWTPWQYFTATRTDQTAGRVIYQWDELNNREQLVYGDTGMRLINVGLPALTAGNVRIVREGRTVALLLGTAVFGTLAGAGVDVLELPVGFRPVIDHLYPLVNAPNHVNIRPGPPAGLRIYNLTAGQQLTGTWSFRTNDPWPTVLPGTAIGSIPNL